MGTSIDSEIRDDLRHGHIVIIWARWAIVVFAFLMRLYRPEDLTELVVSVLGLLTVALVNFTLHVQVMMKRPPKVGLVYLASAMDICLITLITGLQGGVHSNVFVYYFPAVLGFALVFPGKITVELTGGVLALYVGVCALASDPSLESGDEAMLFLRILALIGVALVGNRFRSVEAMRRNTTADGEQRLEEELRRQTTPQTAETQGGRA